MVDLRQTQEFAHFLRLTGWQTKRIGNDYLFIRRLPLTPLSLIKIQRPSKISWKKINQLAQKHHALQIIFEPNLDFEVQELKKRGYRLTRSTFLPSKTLRIDLSQPAKKILCQMKKDSRYGIRKAEKNKIKIQKAKRLTSFRQAWQKAVSWRQYVPTSKTLIALKTAFGPQAVFLVASHQQQIVAGTIILLTSESAYYYYAFTSKVGRQKSAQYLLVWQAIQLAKKAGCRWFDFEGIVDPRWPRCSWQGFSHFKKSFGGREVTYPGCWQKFRLPW